MFILSGVLFVFGAVISELLNKDMESDSWGYALAIALEEGLEMSGALLFLLLNLREMSEEGVARIETRMV